MTEQPRVLFATDDSIAARAGEPWLANARWASPPALSVLVVGAPTFAAQAWLQRAKHPFIHSTVDQLTAAEVARAQALAGEVAERLVPHVASVEAVAFPGMPAREILGYAAHTRPDLVIIGSRGRSEFAPALLGSVSQQVVAHAAVPVLVARPGRVQPGDLPNTIVLIVDGTLLARAAMAWLLESGWLRGARLIVCGLLGVQPGLDEHQVEVLEEMSAEIRMAARDALHQLAEVGRSQAAEVSIELEMGHPLQAALGSADRHLADLMVVARRPHEPGEHPLVEKLARYAAVSVLAVPTGAAQP
jgi:nucleotide-binding universal stress UspA family protein